MTETGRERDRQAYGGGGVRDRQTDRDVVVRRRKVKGRDDTYLWHLWTEDNL